MTAVFAGDRNNHHPLPPSICLSVCLSLSLSPSSLSLSLASYLHYLVPDFLASCSCVVSSHVMNLVQIIGDEDMLAANFAEAQVR